MSTSEPEPVPEPAPMIPNESQNMMEIDTQIMESEESEPQGPTYVEQVASIEAAAPTGLTIRLNDDDLEDVRRLNEDLIESTDKHPFVFILLSTIFHLS